MILSITPRTRVLFDSRNIIWNLFYAPIPPRYEQISSLRVLIRMHNWICSKFEDSLKLRFDSFLSDQFILVTSKFCLRTTLIYFPGKLFYSTESIPCSAEHLTILEPSLDDLFIVQIRRWTDFKAHKCVKCSVGSVRFLFQQFKHSVFRPLLVWPIHQKEMIPSKIQKAGKLWEETSFPNFRVSKFYDWLFRNSYSGNGDRLISS